MAGRYASPVNKKVPDPYQKLRPYQATPEDEICQCSEIKVVMLRDSFSSNPICCAQCNGEVVPERVGFDVNLASDIAGWLSIYHALYILWLDSGPYENWAISQLLDHNGEVNNRGRAIVRKLNKFITAYYWWFQDIGADDYSAPEHCPICQAQLQPYSDRDFQMCNHCSIFI